MDKKYIKIIKHLYKNLQKKDELKDEFDKTSNSILVFSGFSCFTPLFISLSLTGGLNLIVEIFFISIFIGIFIQCLCLFTFKFNLFNRFITKRLNKFNLFNEFGREYDFNIFLFNILTTTIKLHSKEELLPYTNEIFHIINSIDKQSFKNDIKMQFIEKMEVDSQLIDLITDKIENNETLKVDCRSIVVNN